METAEEREVVVEDAVLGTITVRTVMQESVELSGDGVPPVLVRRRAGSGVNEYVPVGSRVPGDVEMTVGGVEVDLVPSKGALSRRSYTVLATVGGVTYRLRPVSTSSSALERDGKRLGQFFGGEDLLNEWVIDADRTPRDVAVGLALAAAFGTGALPAWLAAIELVAVAVPG